MTYTAFQPLEGDCRLIVGATLVVARIAEGDDVRRLRAVGQGQALPLQ